MSLPVEASSPWSEESGVKLLDVEKVVAVQNISFVRREDQTKRAIEANELKSVGKSTLMEYPHFTRIFATRLTHRCQSIRTQICS